MKHLFIFFIISASIFGQTGLGPFILKNATEVRSINFSDTAYDDLETLGLAIKGYSVIMLGESGKGSRENQRKCCQSFHVIPSELDVPLALSAERA